MAQLFRLDKNTIINLDWVESIVLRELEGRWEISIDMTVNAMEQSGWTLDYDSEAEALVVMDELEALSQPKQKGT